jgi:cytochrome b6-f complex iron-sulfur subunit
MRILGISSSQFAIIVVIGLIGLFFLLLLASFVRARRAAKTHAPAEPGAPAPPAAPKPRTVMTRRDFFRTGLVSSLLVFTAQFGGASLAFLWPRLTGGFGSVITLPDSTDTIKTQITDTRQPYYYGAGRFYLINYTGDGTEPGGPYDGITADGLMALYQKCAHLGCRVPFCDQSQWFECPCHGSKYNYAGEWELGPAPNGLMRFTVTVDGQAVKVDTSRIIPGPPRGTNTINQPPEGPFCV